MLLSVSEMVAGLSCLADVDASCCPLLPTRKHWRKISLFQSQLSRHDKRKIVPKLKRGKTEPKNKKKKQKKNKKKKKCQKSRFVDATQLFRRAEWPAIAFPLLLFSNLVRASCYGAVDTTHQSAIKRRSSRQPCNLEDFWFDIDSTRTNDILPRGHHWPSLSLSLCYPSQLLLYTNYRNISTEW